MCAVLLDSCHQRKRLAMSTQYFACKLQKMSMLTVFASQVRSVNLKVSYGLHPRQNWFGLRASFCISKQVCLHDCRRRLLTLLLNSNTHGLVEQEDTSFR